MGYLKQIFFELRYSVTNLISAQWPQCHITYHINSNLDAQICSPGMQLTGIVDIKFTVQITGLITGLCYGAFRYYVNLIFILLYLTSAHVYTQAVKGDCSPVALRKRNEELQISNIQICYCALLRFSTEDKCQFVS